MSGVFQYYQDSKSSKIMKAFESLVPHVSAVYWFHMSVSRIWITVIYAALFV